MIRPWSVLRAACLAAALAGTGLAQSQPSGLYDLATLRTLELTFKQQDWWNQLAESKKTETYLRADLKVDGRLFQGVGVRTRGSQSYWGPYQAKRKKLPFKISLDHFVSGQEFLGYDTLNLNNGWADPSMIRSVLAMRMAREFLPAPKANFVKVVINNENWGVYTNMQVVDRQFVAEHFRSDDGHRFKAVYGFMWLGPNGKLQDYQLNWPLVSKPDPNAYPTLIRMLKATAITPVSQKVIDMPKLVDVDLCWRNLAFDCLIGNDNSFPKNNFYLYTDLFHDQLSVVPWDEDYAFGSFRYGITNVPPFLGDTSLWQRRYEGHLRNMIERFLDWKLLGKWVAELQGVIDKEVQADGKKFFSYSQYQAAITQTIFQYTGIKPNVETRLAQYKQMPFMKRARVMLSAPRHDPKSNTVTVQAKSSIKIHRVVLHYRSRGWFRELVMLDDGNHGDGGSGDGVFGMKIPAQPAGSQVDYYFSAEADLNQGGDVNYLPVSGPHRAFSFRVPPKHDSVLISELLARNSNGLKDEAGDRDDWIELLNPTSQPIQLDGRFLTDNSAEPKKWAFPAGTTVPANGRLIVWADEEPTEGKLHASFKLSGDGEELALVDTDGNTLLDRVEFGPQAKDVSLGRLFDRVSPFVTYRLPTPNTANELSPCGVRELGPPVPMDATMRLSATGSFKPGSDLTLQLAGAPKNSAWLLQVGTQPDVLRLPPGIDVYSMVKLPPVLEVVLPTDAAGLSALKARIPDKANLVGVKLSFWGASHDGQRFVGANGLELGICPR